MTSPARPQLLRTDPGIELVSIEIYSHGPQWQKRVRFAVGTASRMVGHGQAFCSAEMAELLIRVFQSSGVQCRIADRSGPNPVFYRSDDKRPHTDERTVERGE